MPESTVPCGTPKQHPGNQPTSPMHPAHRATVHPLTGLCVQSAVKQFGILLALLTVALPAAGQTSPGRAAALSLLLPGLGHSQVQEGSWRGAASYFVLAEASLWLGLVTSQWQRQQTVQSYRTWATTYADALLDGKDRRFFVTLGTYLSSDAYRADQLRRRRWDQVGYVNDPAYQWHWQSEANMLTFRDLRRQADTWTQRRTAMLAALVVNRIIAALSARRSAQRQRVTVALTAPPQSTVPMIHAAFSL